MGTATTEPRNIVLIHGLFLTWSSWDGWADRFSKRGFNANAPRLARTRRHRRRIARRSDTIYQAQHRDGRRPLRSQHPRTRLTADHHRTFVRRTVRSITRVSWTRRCGSRSRFRRSRRVPSLPFSTLRAVAPVLANPSPPKNHKCSTTAMPSRASIASSSKARSKTSHYTRPHASTWPLIVRRSSSSPEAKIVSSPRTTRRRRLS